MKIALFPSGRRGPNENRLQKWKYEACAKILNLSEKLEQQNLIALKLWLQGPTGWGLLYSSFQLEWGVVFLSRLKQQAM